MRDVERGAQENLVIPSGMFSALCRQQPQIAGARLRIAPKSLIGADVI